MFQTRKLKPDRSIGKLIYPLSVLLSFGVSTLIFGFVVGFIVLASFFWIYALYALFIFIRTGNLGHLVVAAYQVYMGIILLLAAQYLTDLDTAREEWKIAWITGVIVFGILIIYLAWTKKIKWRGREIFELAAETVEEAGNGYTPRPRPVGRVEFSRQELLAFGRFCARNLIGLVYLSPRQATLVPIKMGDEYSFLFRSAGSQLEQTWISFDFDGDVSVHIAQKDYLDFQEPLAFDKLCESLGRLFIEFAELHQRGEGVRIIDRMDALQLNYFS